MKKILALLLGLALTGCTLTHYKDSAGNEYSSRALFWRSEKSGLLVSPKTGLHIKSEKGEVDSEGIDSLGNLLGKVAEGAAKGAAKPIVPIP